MAQYMWGTNGEYGPFSQGKDGYPHSGEVVRYYRIVRGVSAAQFGELYGKALAARLSELSSKPVDEQPKSRIWVLTMEKRNQVPLDITRRRVIADLLGIPYILLGLGEGLTKQALFSLEEPNIPRIPRHQTMAQQALHEHQQAVALYFNGYYHRHGQSALALIEQATHQLHSLIELVPEHAKITGIALMARYHQFGSLIAREQQQYPLALTHADTAIRYAQEVHKIKPNSDLLAITLYRRGLTNFEEAITRPDGTSNMQDALPLLDASLSYADHATLSTRSLIALEWALVHAYVATSDDERRQVRKLLKQSYHDLSQKSTDPDEEFTNYTQDWYQITMAEALIALGEYTEALGELEVAEELTPLTFPRRLAYIDALRAKAHFELGEVEESTRFAKDALSASKAVKSEFNITRIARLYTQLRSVKRSSEVTELGHEIGRTHPHLLTSF